MKDEERAGPPPLPLPPESCPSPLDLLRPCEHGLAHEMAKAKAAEKRETSDACSSIFRLTIRALPEVVAEIRGWSDAKRDAEVKAFEARQAEARCTRAREAEARRRGKVIG